MSLQINPNKIQPDMSLNEALVVLSKGTEASPFLKDIKQNVVLYVITKEWERVWKNALIAGCAGAVGGGVAGFFIGGPVGIPIGAVAGFGAAGLAAGAITVLFKTIHKQIIVEVDPVYHEWRKIQIAKNINRDFEVAVLNHNLVIDLKCSISLDFPHIPVLAPCKHIYNKIDIEQHIDVIEKRIFDREIVGNYSREGIHTCPSGMPGIYTKADLVFQEDRLYDIIDKCMKLNTVLASGNNKMEYSEGLVAAATQASITLENISLAKQIDLFKRTAQDRRDGKEIDEKAYAAEQIANIPKKYASIPAMCFRQDDKESKVNASTMVEMSSTHGRTMSIPRMFRTMTHTIRQQDEKESKEAYEARIQSKK